MNSLRERFGKPQFVAGFLLLVYLGQCLWLQFHSRFDPRELLYLGHSAAADPMPRPAFVDCSPIVPAITHLVVRVSGLPPGREVVRFPFLVMGLLLGASHWYVSRRLYGNAGGYLALLLFVFSAPMIVAGALVSPDLVAAWGTFGMVFTGIAVSHTLYAPREVVLWNWKRILLLGLSIGLGVGAQMVLVALIPLVLVFMFYLAPHRRGAALLIFGSGAVIGLLVMSVGSWLSGESLRAAFQARCLWGLTLQGASTSITYRAVGTFFLQDSAMTILLLVSLVTYAAWPRTRFFGVTAPLIVGVALLAFSALVPYDAMPVLRVVSLPFLLVFIAGVFADLLESSHKGLVLAVLITVLAWHALFGFRALAKVEVTPSQTLANK